MSASPSTDVPARDGDWLAAMRSALQSAPAFDRHAAFPRDWWRHMAAQGLLGLGFDADGSQPRADAATVSALAGLIARETCSLGLALAWLMNEMLGRFVLAPHVGNEAQRVLLRLMTRGEKILALAVSEAGVGAHPKHLSCRARLHEDHWQVDGGKSFVSNGPAADAYIVLAVSRELQGRKIFDAFIIDADAPGLNKLPAQQPPVLQPLGHCGLQLQNCRVPRARRLAAEGRAYELIAKPLRTIEDALLIGPLVGAMQAELDAVATWLRGTMPPPATLRSLGALQLELNALTHLAGAAARQLETDGPDEALADLNVGVRRALERWQNDCESLAATLDDHHPNLLALARDIRTVLGIARSIGESRQLAAGHTLFNPKETHEIAA